MSLSDLLNLSPDKKVAIFDDAVRYIFAKYLPGNEILDDKVLEKKGLKWLSAEDQQLYQEISENKTISEIAGLHRRTTLEIISRLKKYALELHQQGEDMETIISSTLLSQSQIEDVIERTKKVEETKPLPKTAKNKAKTSSSAKKEYTGDLTSDQEIKFAGLKVWRNQVSKDLEWPAYMVLSNNVLKSIAFHQPQNEEDLLLIKGMGAEKVGRYSDAIIEIVNRAAPSRILPSKTMVIKKTPEINDGEPLTYIPPFRFLAKNK